MLLLLHGEEGRDGVRGPETKGTCTSLVTKIKKDTARSLSDVYMVVHTYTQTYKQTNTHTHMCHRKSFMFSTV